MSTQKIAAQAKPDDLERDQLCYIDPETARTLELLSNDIDQSNRRDTLLGFLNKTSTTTGYRMLKEEIAQPLAHVTTLEHRLDCIEQFLLRFDSHALVIRELGYFGRGIDLDTIVPTLVQLATSKGENLRLAEKRLDIITTLHTVVGRVPNLTAALKGIDHPILNMYMEALEDPEYGLMNDQIKRILDFSHKESKQKKGRLFAIRPGYSDLFDIARETYRDAIENLYAYVSEIANEDHIPWKLNYADTKGHFITAPIDRIGNVADLSPKYIRVVKTRNMISCSTADIMHSNVRTKVSYENSMKLANEVLLELLQSILGNVDILHKLNTVVGRLDLMSSLAKLAIEYGGRLVRPKFSTMDTIIEESRHPVLEKMLEANQQVIVPNDICLSVKHGNFCLITGPNMGGKSVYLKQVALIYVMAQIGSFVPAKSAIIKPVNKIVVRVGTSDDGQSSCSSFMSEMRGIASALSRETDLSSLYIIDEVGRGTNVEDGSAYSLAIAEELAQRKNSFTIFSTHFPMLLTLPSFVDNVKIFQFKIEVDENNKRNNYLTHQLIPGYSEKYHYGIELASDCGLPAEIVDGAKSILGI